MSFNTGYAPAAAAPKKSWFGPGMVAALIGLLLVGFLAIFVISNVFKYQKLGVESENQIEAMYKSNQNNLGQFVLKVKESLGVAKLNNEGLDNTIRNALTGRYGDGGAQQAMLWVKENYPGAYDPSLMKTVQQTILAGRTDFEQKQNLLIDRVRVYKNDTELLWSGTWLKLVGFPRSSFDFDKYKPVVASSTAKTFETKVDEGIEIK